MENSSQGQRGFMWDIKVSYGREQSHVGQSKCLMWERAFFCGTGLMWERAVSCKKKSLMWDIKPQVGESSLMWDRVKVSCRREQCKVG